MVKKELSLINPTTTYSFEEAQALLENCTRRELTCALLGDTQYSFFGPQCPESLVARGYMGSPEAVGYTGVVPMHVEIGCSLFTEDQAWVLLLTGTLDSSVCI